MKVSRLESMVLVASALTAAHAFQPFYTPSSTKQHTSTQAYLIPNTSRSSSRSSLTNDLLSLHTNSFFQKNIHKSSSSSSKTTAAAATTTTTSLSMIFERMSEECIGALVTAQNESARLGQPTVGTEIMTVGIADRPENARRTLKKYGVTLRKIKRTAEDMFQPENEDGDSSSSSNTLGRMLNMNKKARDVELPFTPSLKRVLNLAAKTADKLEATSGAMIRSEHVLLALLGWEENTFDQASAKLDEDGYAKGALAVFLQVEGMDEQFSATEFCRSLIRDVRDNASDDAELVSGLRSGKENTPTLDECGVDLTKAAEDGELDDVYGRDDEIKSSLRTLVRRRKNNPCLIGEPGVG